MLVIRRYFSDNNHYNDKLSYGEQYANAISWIFSKSKCGSEGERFCLSRYIMSDVMSCVVLLIAQAKNSLGKQDIKDIIVKLRPDDPMRFMMKPGKISNRNSDNGTPVLVFENMDWGFIQSVLWCAYIYWEFLTFDDNDLNVRASKALFEALLDASGYKRESFIKGHFLMKRVKHTAKIFLDSIDDLEKKQKVQEKLVTSGKEMLSDKESASWKQMVERLVKPFDDVMAPIGFYDMPMIKRLTRYGQCELIMKLFLSKIPFKVALLNHINFIEILKQNKDYDSQTSRLRLIEEALNLRKDNRDLKGNFNVLDPSSNEDKSRYTVLTLKDKAKEFYESLESTTPN